MNTVRWNQERIEHARIPEWVLDADISDRAVRLYAVLGRYADNINGTAFPKQATLADRLRCSVDSLERAMKELEAIGALMRERRGPHSNLYTLVWRLDDRTHAAASPKDSAPTRKQDSAPVQTLDSAPVRDRTIGQKELDPVELESSTTASAVVSRDAATYDPRKGMKIDGHNLPWDALVDATSADPVTEKGRIATALKVIRGAVVRQWPMSDELTPEMSEAFIATEIAIRARLYRDRWPKIELTPTALAHNWSRVMTPQPGRSLDTALEAAQRGIDSARRTT